MSHLRQGFGGQAGYRYQDLTESEKLKVKSKSDVNVGAYGIRPIVGAIHELPSEIWSGFETRPYVVPCHLTPVTCPLC